MTLMIGANDFFLCQETTADGCASPTEQAAVAKRVTANIKSILTAIRRTAHYRGQLAIVNYYSLELRLPGHQRGVPARSTKSRTRRPSRSTW